jgi:chaperonin GroEL (HSP60 family)
MTDKVNESKQQAGASARTVCIDIARQLSDIVKHTLGPSGLDNMLVDAAKDVVITNDGATIMKESDIDHPVAKVIMDVARTQEEQCFDGTTSSIILTGALMEEASTLLKSKIHPTKIAIGYQIAAIKAEELLMDMGVEVNEEILDKVAQTAMTGKSAEPDKEHLARICVEVAMAAPLADINIVRRPNGKIRDSTAISGLLIDGQKASHEMPDAVEDPKIGLIAADIDIPDYAQALNVQVTNNSEVQDFIAGRNAQLIEMAQKILATGMNVLFCSRDIHPAIIETFANEGLYLVRRVRRSDMEALANSTGARIIVNVETISEKDLGTSKLLEEVNIGERPMVKLTGTPNESTVSVLVRAPTQHVVDEIKRAFDDAIGVVSIAYEDQSVLPGGGAPYLTLSSKLKEYAATVGGREQMAVESFANALEVIPKTLAENCGLDPIDSLIALRKAHTQEDGWKYGINVNDGTACDMLEADVIEPKRVSAQAIRNAADIASQLIRIEKIITARRRAEIGDDDFQY